MQLETLHAVLRRQIQLGGAVPEGYAQSQEQPQSQPQEESVSPERSSVKRGPPPTVSVKAGKTPPSVTKLSSPHKRRRVVDVGSAPYKDQPPQETSKQATSKPSQLCAAPIIHPDTKTVTSARLIRAADKGDLGKVLSIIESGVPILAVDTVGRTALHAAASNLRPEIVDRLLHMEGCR